MELTILMPCLNEAETLGLCIKQIKKNLRLLNVKSEIIVADNGSTDNSLKIAKQEKVRIVNIKKKGYGAALKEGIIKAKGKYVLFADADCSYNFNLIPKFYKEIIKGYDLVQGCRLPKYGGKIKPKAMPFLHRYFGNPFLSMIAKVFHQLPFNDIYCGMRIFRTKLYRKLSIISDGMVFAIEHLIKTYNISNNVKEIPITLYKDGRQKNKSHLKTFSDGFESIKFLLIFLPKIVFFIPSSIITIIAIFLIFKSTEFNLIPNYKIDYNLFISILLLLMSYQIALFGIASKFISAEVGFYRSKKNFFWRFVQLKYSLLGTFFLLFIAFILKIFDFNFIEPELKMLSVVLLVYFSIINLINSIMISLIEFLSKKKK